VARKDTIVGLLVVAIAVVGLAVGSFLNVVIHRVPMQQSLSRPPSHCPSCGHPVRKRHNVPVLGWVLLRGRCADCRHPIGVRYPLVELATAGLFVAVAVRLARLDLLAALPAYLFFAAAGICLTAIDLDVRRLPNAIVLPAYPILATLLTGAALVEHDPAALLRAGIGAAGLFGFYFGLAFLYPAGMGFGDVKLAGLIGGVLGFLSYSALLIGAFAAFFIGSAVGLLVIASRRGTGKTAIPFGPFMITAALLAFFAGGPLTELYSRLILQA
jgi:leader peptidase (prepilin peptidase)/N-methyltransferase